MTPHKKDAHIVKAGLIDQLPRLIECLFSGRHIRRMPHEYRIGTQGSISIRLADGSYFNHETGSGGDVFSLIQHALKTDFKGALLWARAFIGQFNIATATMPLQETLCHKIDERAARQRDKALALIKRTTSIMGALAGTYLRDIRGITLSPMPPALGFVAYAHNFTADGFHPAMVATISNLDGEPIAAHCTFLDPATGDKLRGDSIKSRLIIGACRGGAIHLAPATERLALCEGIEDGLSIMQCTPDWPVWATGGTSGLRAVQIPAHVREVLICADRDDAGMQAAHDLSQRLVADGKKVRIAVPPDGVKDFNELLRRRGHHAN